jgi:hypothetical protein
MDDEVCICCGHELDEHESDFGPCEREECHCRVYIAPAPEWEPEELDFSSHDR